MSGPLQIAGGQLDKSDVVNRVLAEAPASHQECVEIFPSYL